MRIIAVIVSYFPDLSLLERVVRAAAEQTDSVILIDNNSSSYSAADFAGTHQTQFIANCRNRGIAAAQNRGIEYARSHNFTHILFLDQDSVLPSGAVAELAKNLQQIEKAGHRIAAIGPRYDEANSGLPGRVFISRGCRVHRVVATGGLTTMETDFIISSGSLVPIDVFDHVGGFEEDLFIDLVDIEWCFRARSRGFRTYMVLTTGLAHHLGTGIVRLGSQNIPLHAPTRNYFWVRNAIALMRRRYTPFAWKLYFLSRVLLFPVVYPIFADQRLRRLRLIWAGISDGLMGRFASGNNRASSG